MNKGLRKLLAGPVAVPGHSLLVLLVALAVFGFGNFLPDGLAWVLRVAGFLLLGVFARLATSDLPALADWLVRSPLAWYEGLCGVFNARAVWLKRCEILLAAAVVLPAAIHFGQSIRAMSAASLRVDEIGSVMSYSSRGPLLAATNYNLAKNHIFFSVVNSLTPGSGSLAPVRARFWSFVAVGVSLVLLLVFFWRLGSPLSGAVALALPALNLEHLSEVLEARGYGFVALAAVVGLVAAHGFLRAGRTRELWVLGVSTALGTWTLPFYVVFGGGLMGLLFLVQPSKKVFVAGAATCFGIVALYAPVLVQISRVAAGYKESYGVGFECVVSVLAAMRYVVPQGLVKVDGILVPVAVLLVVALPLALRKHCPQNNTSLQMASATVLAFYIFCLVLGSPPLRITSFLAMPIAFVAGMLACQVLTFPAMAPFRLFLAAGLASVFLLYGNSTVKAFAFQPDQRWRDAAVAVRALFPGGAEVFVSGYRNALSAYLGKTFEVREQIPAGQDLRGGTRLLFSSAHLRRHRPVDVAALYPALELSAVRFPLRDSKEQTLYLHVPPEFVIRDLRIGDEKAVLPARIPPGAHAKIVLPAPARSLHLLFRDQVDGLAAESSLPLTKAGNLISLQLPETARDVQIRFPREAGALLEAAWAYPKGF